MASAIFSNSAGSSVIEPFDPKKWLQAFASSNHAQRKKLRVEIMQGTLAACKNFKYNLHDGTEIEFANSESVSNDAKKTTLHDVDAMGHIDPRMFLAMDKTIKTAIVVVNVDCLKEAIRLKEKGYNPAVLNMASPRRPGGGYLSGAGAQEENLFRRTNYVQHLADPDKVFDPERKWTYRLPEFSCVHSTNVLIIRDTEQEGYKFLRNPIPMSFLAVSAYPNPPLTHSKQRLMPEMAEKTKQKIRVMFATGLNHGHDSLVLSALGCGAFRNPPRHMAELFKQVLLEDNFVNKYKHISFAIIDDHNSRGEGNYQAFFEVFDKE